MQLDILAFGAHPDDVELFAGGTLAKMAAMGYATGVVDMSRGELGTRGTVAVRTKEAKKAAKALGLRMRETLGLPDGDIRATAAARLKVIRILRKYRPPIVLVHHWDDRHPDHVNTSQLVTEAAHHAGFSKIRTGQDRFRPTAVLYYKLPRGTFPSFVVDVSEHAGPRLEAIKAHASQLFNPSSREPGTYLSQPDFLARVSAVHGFYGALIGKSLGEGFLFKGTLEIHDLVELFKHQKGERR